MNCITSLRKKLGTLSKTIALLGMYGLLAAVVLVSFDIILRKAFNRSFVGADELSGYALAIATAWGTSYALHLGNHIRIDICHRLLPSKTRAFLDVMSLISLIGFTAVLVWYTGDLALESWLYNVSANTPLRVPLWIPQIPWVAGLTLFLVSAIVMLIEAVGHLVKGEYSAITHLVGGTEIALPYSPQENAPSHSGVTP